MLLGLCAEWLTLLFFTKYPVREYFRFFAHFFLHSSRSGNFFFRCLRIVYVVCAICVLLFQCLRIVFPCKFDYFVFTGKFTWLCPIFARVSLL